MKGFLILLVTAIVICVGNRTQGVHKHRHGRTGHKPERYWEYHIEARYCQEQTLGI